MWGKANGKDPPVSSLHWRILMAADPVCGMEVDEATPGGSGGLCFINALDPRVANPLGWMTGVAVIVMAFVGVHHFRRKKELS